MKSCDTRIRSRARSIIFTFLELSEKNWGGCHTVNSISYGIDTSTPKEKTQENEPMPNSEIKMMMIAAVFN